MRTRTGRRAGVRAPEKRFLINRNSIGIDIEPEYCRMAARHLKAENTDLFATSKLLFEKLAAEPASLVKEDHALYEVRPAKKRLE